MSSIFSAALEGLALASNEPECVPSPSAKSIPTAAASSPGIGQMSLFSEMSESLPQRGLWPTPDTHAGHHGGQGKNASLRRLAKGKQLNIGHAVAIWPSTSSAAASPARTSPRQERARALAGLARDYGASTPELLARYDQLTSSWKTSQLCLDGALSEYSETWPRSGTMRSGTAYLLPPLVRLTDETGSGLLPTPVASEGAAASSHARTWSTTYASLHNYATGKGKQNPMWPTPTSRDWKGGSAQACANVPVNALLGRAVHQFRTPQARDGIPRGPQTPEKRQAGGHSVGLGDQIGGALNPMWVEWLMGFPLGWTALEPSATPSSRKSRKSSAAQS